MGIVIEKASPTDAAAMLDYLRQIGGETDNLTFGAEGLSFTIEEEAAHIKQTENSCDEIMLVRSDNASAIHLYEK